MPLRDGPLDPILFALHAGGQPDHFVGLFRRSVCVALAPHLDDAQPRPEAHDLLAPSPSTAYSFPSYKASEVNRHRCSRHRGDRLGPRHLAGEPERIFRRFSRAAGVFGAGLPVVQAIAEAHHGSVRVYSKGQDGWTFGMVIPAVLAGRAREDG